MRTALTAALALVPLFLRGDESARLADAEGDEVVLIAGLYQGTLGIFLRLKEDIHWAEISERSGNIRSHPVAWLAHSRAATAGLSKVPGDRR